MIAREQWRTQRAAPSLPGGMTIRLLSHHSPAVSTRTPISRQRKSCRMTLEEKTLWTLSGSPSPREKVRNRIIAAETAPDIKEQKAMTPPTALKVP